MENGGIYIYIYICSVTLLQKMSTRVKSCQVKELVLLSLLNISVVGSKVSSYLKTTRRGFQLLIPQKQNPHTHINQLAVTAKILSQPGIQLCVASAAVHHGKQTVMGCRKEFPGLFNIHISSEHRSYL